MLEADIAWAVANCSIDPIPASYYAGAHRLTFATDQFRNAFGLVFQAVRANLCPPVVDIPCDRLRIRGFTGTSADQASRLWRTLKLHRVAGDVHTRALTDGWSYAIATEPGDQGRLIAQAPGVIAWDPDPLDVDRPKRAAKLWIGDDQHGRLTLYLPDGTYRFRSVEKLTGNTLGKARWAPYEDDDAPAETPNLDGIIPVFRFGLGRSELVDVIPLQDALNKQLCDMLVASEFGAFPQRWAMGLDPGPLDPVTGKPLNPPFQAGADRVWTIPNIDGKFGEFSTADLGQFLEVVAGWKGLIADVTGIPHRLLGAKSPAESGEAKKVDEARLVAGVEDLQSVLGDQWETALAYLGVAGDDLEAQWSPAATRDLTEEVTVAEATVRIHPGLRRPVLQRMGWTEEELDAADEQEAAHATEAAVRPGLADALLAGFDAGA